MSVEEHPQPLRRRPEVRLRVERTQRRIVGHTGIERGHQTIEGRVPAHRIVIGHSCGTADHDYHLKIAQGGSYLGFDRFGLEKEMPDEKRLESLWKLMTAGFGDRVVVSQDTVWCWPGKPDGFPTPDTWHVLRFVRDLAPRLIEMGASKEDIDTLLRTNPRRYFEGAPLA